MAPLDQASAQWTLAIVDGELKGWLTPHLERLTTDARRSVAGRARKALARPAKA